MGEEQRALAKPTGAGPIQVVELEFRVLQIADGLKHAAQDFEQSAGHLSDALDSLERLLRSPDKLPVLELRIRQQLVSAILAAQADTFPEVLGTSERNVQEAYDAAIVGAIFLTTSVEARAQWHPDVLHDARGRITILRNLAHNRCVLREIGRRETVRFGVIVGNLLERAKAAA